MLRLRFFSDDTQIAFMRTRFVSLGMALCIFVVSWLLFLFIGLNYGIDFRGGILVEIRTPEPASFPALRSTLDELDLGRITLQQFGSPRDVLIRLERQPGPESAQQQAIEKIRNTLTETEIRRVEAVGATVSAELVQNGILAVTFGLLAMLCYIWFRFEWQFGVGALLTLLIDITAMIGVYAVTNIQFNLTSVAAILTIIGYSINDKVVVYDRIRENLRLYKKVPLITLLDKSINQTLNRTVGTSVTTLLAALPLALFGGSALISFSVPLIVGIIIGTLSSIFIAAPLLLFLGEGQLRQTKTVVQKQEKQA